MIAGLANIGATNQDPPVIEVVLPNATRKHKEVAQAQQNNPFLNPLVQERQSGFLSYQNIYFKGAAGINILPEVVNTGSSGNDNTMEFDPGFAFSGGIGVDFENDFRLEAEVIWATYSTLDQLVGSANGIHSARPPRKAPYPRSRLWPMPLTISPTRGRIFHLYMAELVWPASL